MAVTDNLTEQTSEITLSDRAAEELQSLITENNKDNAFLRVWVQGGGCSGLSYGMALDEQLDAEDDRVFTDHNVRIVVDALSLKYMTGSVVDYVDDVLGGGFKIENPNAVRSCGCGSSFSTEDEGIPGLETGGKGCGGCGCH
jgi:iron-sulfur cluster assembly protein